MRGRKLAIRVLGVASTIRGFAFALTEGPGCLVKVGNHATPAKGPKLEATIDSVLAQSRPMFVAVEHMSGRKQERFRQFAAALGGCCEARQIKVLTVGREQFEELAGTPDVNKWRVAQTMAQQFPEVAHKLPAPRTPWKSEDDRFGIFTALAAAMWTWRSFRRPAPDSPTSQRPAALPK
jgi:hypothetical protein